MLFFSSSPHSKARFLPVTSDMKDFASTYWSRSVCWLNLLPIKRRHFILSLHFQIADHVGFKYNIELVPDNNYGALNLSTGQWNGLVRVWNFFKVTFINPLSIDSIKAQFILFRLHKKRMSCRLKTTPIIQETIY
jgi:WD40 repeat protein